MAQTTNIEDTIKRGESGYELASDITTLTSLIDGENPETDDFAAMLVPMRDNLRKALEALLAADIVLNRAVAAKADVWTDARELVEIALTGGLA